MHGGRQKNAQDDLQAIPIRTSLLDVGCGRGEMLDFAMSIGFRYVRGVEIVPYLCDGERVIFAPCHALPFGDGEFDTVISNDVIEHVLRGDDELLCREMRRVAKRHILITANNMPSTLPDGTDLHINKRPYQEWDALFRGWFGGAVTWIPTNGIHATERWRIDL
jgi:SAM-dependent methyltransferase